TPHGGIVDQHFDINDMVDNFGYWNLTADNSTGWSYDISTTPSDELLNQNAGATYMKLLKAPGGSAGSAYNWSSDVLNSGILCEGVNVISGALHTFNASSNPTNTPTDVIPATGLTTFSDFGIAKSGTFGLPIELVSLKATPVDNEFIRVDWVTATEINNAGFEVHRSTDGVNFREIGWVDGAGNSTDELEYAFDDHDVESNKTYYYRLKQIDYDGAFELTYIVNAKITQEGILTVGNFIPNPSNGNSYINVNSSEVHKIRVQIFTTLGQIINVKDFEINPGLNRMDFDFSMLADGTYHAVIMVDENEVHNKKIVITK
ncbi:MAG: T9SS type A sorting domain-containing protein, partial [Chitinophagales bacterium]